MRKAYFTVYIVWLSLKWVFKVNLGDTVTYRGQEFVVSNGVYPKSWRLIGLQNDDDGWVKRTECRKVRTPSNYVGSFRFGWRFYKGYWLDIWCNKGIKPWMRRCKIW